MRLRGLTTCCFFTASAASAWWASAAPVGGRDIDEAKARKVRAAYLYNFAKFVKWPAGAFKDDKAPFVIGVLGDDPFDDTLDDTVKGKTIHGRVIQVRRFHWEEEKARSEPLRCHLLYIARSERGRLSQVLAVLKKRPVLVVSDIAGFAHNGGMIGFVLEKGRIAFEINREALEQAHLKASSKLLKLARIVKSRKRREPKSQGFAQNQ
ncbi:MAG: YfiR family protein [Phycisphaerae bacterium]